MVTAPLLLSTLPVKVPKRSAGEWQAARSVIVSLDGRQQLLPRPRRRPYRAGAVRSAGAASAELAASQPDNLVYIRADKGVTFDKCATS